MRLGIFDYVYFPSCSQILVIMPDIEHQAAPGKTWLYLHFNALMTSQRFIYTSQHLVIHFLALATKKS